jgi:hypothetical protein
VVALGLLAPGAAIAGDSVGRSISLMGAGPTPSEILVAEDEWASDLVDFLGLEAVLPAQPDPADLFALLCADQAELALAAGGRQLPADGTFRVPVEAPRRQSAGGPVRITVSVPATTLYQLSVEGAGLQRWVIDHEPVGHLDVSLLGVAQAQAIVPLRKGPHEISGFLAPGARTDRIELAAHRPLCIAPADGWRQDRPLTYGALARTLVRAFGFERRLPEWRDEERKLEGERFDEVSGGGARTGRRLAEPASAGEWAAAVSNPAQFTWELRFEEPRVVTIQARTHGVQPQLWSVDGRYRLTVHPDAEDAGFRWNHVITLPLSSGRHALRALVAPGSGIDAIRVISHRSSDSDYVGVLEELGFRGGAPGAPVPRSVTERALASPAFVELASRFRLRLAGDPSDHPLVLVDDDPAPFRSRSLSPLLPAEL